MWVNASATSVLVTPTVGVDDAGQVAARIVARRAGSCPPVASKALSGLAEVVTAPLTV